MTNNEFVKGSNYSLDEMFELFKDQFLTMKEWSEILIAREGILNYSSLYQIIKKSITYYKNSNKVKSFEYKKNNYWLDKNTRIGLFRLVDSGAESITLQLGDSYLKITPDKLKDFLNELEVYAGQCFATMAEHLQNIRQLQTTDDLVNYDYMAKYPNKVILNEDQH